jgi:hypothetical protein
MTIWVTAFEPAGVEGLKFVGRLGTATVTTPPDSNEIVPFGGLVEDVDDRVAAGATLPHAARATEKRTAAAAGLNPT